MYVSIYYIYIIKTYFCICRIPCTMYIPAHGRLALLEAAKIGHGWWKILSWTPGSKKMQPKKRYACQILLVFLYVLGGCYKYIGRFFVIVFSYRWNLQVVFQYKAWQIEYGLTIGPLFQGESASPIHRGYSLQRKCFLEFSTFSTQALEHDWATTSFFRNWPSGKAT